MKVGKAMLLMGCLTLWTVAFVVNCQEGSQMYCGRRLASALASLCYNGMLLKRSGPPGYSMNGIMSYENQYSWPWISKYKATSLGRPKRQAASECCDKPCTIDELISYCA